MIGQVITWIGSIMVGFIKFAHQFLADYGLDIILLTLIMRVIFFPLSIKQVRNAEKMKIVQPKMKALQEKYKGNKEELARRQMELYKEHKVSLTSGCLPFLLQWPFLIAMYQVLSRPGDFGLAALTKASFLGIPLMAKGTLSLIPFSIQAPHFGIYILAILSGVTTFYQTKLMSPPQAKKEGDAPDPAASMQNSMLMIMPVMMAWFTFVWPAAIGVYWAATNIFTIVQQIVILKYFVHPEDLAGASETDKPKREGPRGR